MPAGLLVQHIRVEALRPQQANLRNKSLTPRDKLFVFGLQGPNFMLNPRTANQSQLAIQGMKAEISERGKGCSRYNEAPQNGLFSLTGWSRHDGDLNARTMVSCESEFDSAGLTDPFASHDNSHEPLEWIRSRSRRLSGR